MAVSQYDSLQEPEALIHRSVFVLLAVKRKYLVTFNYRTNFFWLKLPFCNTPLKINEAIGWQIK
jgi:hypothetical protein